MRPSDILPASLVLLALVACGERTAPRVAPVTTTRTKGAPSWIDQEEIPDGLAAVGIASANPLGDKSFQRTEAIADGRTKLAGKIKVRVQNLFHQLSQRSTAGVPSDPKPVKAEVMQRVQENVTRQLVDQELVGSTSRHFWTDPADGSLYVLVVVTREGLDTALAGIAQAQIRKEIAGGEKDLELALDKLDAAITASYN